MIACASIHIVHWNIVKLLPKHKALISINLLKYIYSTRAEQDNLRVNSG